MPNLLIPIKATMDPISRRVAKSVIDKVIEITNMDDTRVEIRGELGIATNPGGEMGDKGKMNRFAHQGRVIVTFTETYRDSEVINAAVRHADAQPIFEDKATLVLIKPVYSYTDVELNYTYRAASLQEAEMWRNDIKIRLADNRNQHLHELEYHYPVPAWCSLMLRHVHELREKVGGYGESLGEYLRKYYTQRATVVTAPDGDIKKSLLVIAEKQIGVQGWFDFIEPEKAEKNDDGASYNVGFVYKFNYKKPVEVNMNYPLVIHNQLIDARFIPRPFKMDPDKKLNYKGEMQFSLDTFDYGVRFAPRPMGGIAIPDFDEWIPEMVPNWTSSLITWMTVVEPKDLQLIFSERDVLDTGFHPDVLAYMKRCGNRMTQRGACALHLCLYRDTQPIADGDLEIIQTEKAFEVRSKSMPDIRLGYHLRLSFCTNGGLYTPEAMRELSTYGMTTLRMFQTVVNNLDVAYASVERIDPETGELDEPYIKWFFKMLRDTGNGERTDPVGDGKRPDVGNDALDEQTYLDNSSFYGAFDRPYVEILTILAGNRSGVSKDASSVT